MNRFALVIALSAASFGALAQTTPLVNSQAQSRVDTSSAATNQGNAQVIQFNSNGDGKSTTTVKTAPSIGGQSFPGSFSPDSCVTGAGGGASFLPGVAVQGVVPISDKHCMSLRAYERTMQGAAVEQNPERRERRVQAADDIMCQSSPETRAAYTAAGLCSQDFSETADERETRLEKRAPQATRRTSRQNIDSFYGPG